MRQILLQFTRSFYINAKSPENCSSACCAHGRCRNVKTAARGSENKSCTQLCSRSDSSIASCSTPTVAPCLPRGSLFHTFFAAHGVALVLLPYYFYSSGVSNTKKKTQEARPGSHSGSKFLKWTMMVSPTSARMMGPRLPAQSGPSFSVVYVSSVYSLYRDCWEGGGGGVYRREDEASKGVKPAF